MSASPAYRGRFAPSPTGPLHFGSLVAAVGSFLEARSHGGEWLLRMEDVDEPRCPPGNDVLILRALEAHGFAWDGEILVQSRRKARYRECLDALVEAGSVFPCACTRADLAGAPAGIDGAHVYPGTCRGGLPAGREARAWRLRVPEGELAVDDAVQGRIAQDLARDVGDFVLLRADGYFAYQLAVVVDDADQGITHVVRGADLLDSTARQAFLQRCLGVATPEYAHLPVAVNSAGEKLSKQTLARALDEASPGPALVAALGFLGQAPPEAFRRASVPEIWSWALAHWQLDRVPRRRTLPAPGLESAGEEERS
ncbi:MAG: tRNA glutamyl-Q(34) synthetase GluQRS [Rhodocyclaceae bacterium]|nr:tRNA glutamyl-Q(34) synthetase GluQRS [Rhodocyclaceae bacterium]